MTYEIQNKITARLYIFKGCEIVLVVSMCTRTQPPSPVDQQPLVPEAGAQPVPKNGAIVITACHSSIFLLTGIFPASRKINGEKEVNEIKVQERI